MGRKSIEIKITIDSKTALLSEEKHNTTARVRHRCKIVLLYLDGYSVKDISSIMNTNIISIYDWLHRYNAAGFKGLLTQKGQGRKPILEERHVSIVRAAVAQERQRLQKARQIIESAVGRPMSQSTLTRFLKIITALTNE